MITNIYYKKTTWNKNIFFNVTQLKNFFETNLSNGKKNMFVFHVVFL
jgi:hypothetical protein